MSAECAVYVKRYEVVGRLDALVLTEAILRESVQEGTQLRLACTKNDPDYLLGVLASGKITRAIRDRLVTEPHNWRCETYLNQPSTVRSDGRVAIIVAGGTEDTGVDDGRPATRSPKGRATKEAIDRNQASFSEIEPSFRRFDPPAPVDETWVLLYFIDEDKGEVRAEFSLPHFMDVDNHVTKWKERIILSAIPIDREHISLFSEDESDDDRYVADVRPLS